MTSGGYRSVSSRATVARNKKHVSPLSGVVTKLERIDVDLPLNTNFYAGHNFSGFADSVDELRAGLSGGSFGKGSTAEQGEASALMEAIERYCGVYQGDEVRVTRRYTDFAPGEAIVPNDVLLFSDAQYHKAQSLFQAAMRMPHHESPDEHDHHGTPTPLPFDPSAPMEWSPVWSLRDETFKYLPTSMLYFFYKGGPSPEQMIHADSNGCAAGNTLEEAIVQGFLELVERDSYAIWWYNRVQRGEVDLGQFDDPYIRDLKDQLAATGRKVWAIDITTDLGVPTFVGMSYSNKDGVEFVEYGSGSHFDARIAMLRTLTELNQFLSIGLLGARDTSGHDETGQFRLDNHPYLLPKRRGVTAEGPRRRFRPPRYARAGAGLRRHRQARRPRFPGARSDPRRHRCAGHARDRSRHAAFLSPLRARKALRCSGQARLAGPSGRGSQSQSRSIRTPEIAPLARAPTKEDATASARRLSPAGLSVRLLQHVTLEASANGDVAVAFDGHSVGVSQAQPEGCGPRPRPARGFAVARVRGGKKQRRPGGSSAGPASRRARSRSNIALDVRAAADHVVIEPQLPDYWPRIAQLRDTDTLVLSRFAYLRRRADEMVLESPRSGALFKIRDPKIAALLATLATPQKVKALRRQPGFPGLDLLALLLDGQILFKVAAKDKGLRPSEGDGSLVLWDFHDLLFHARSTEGRHANPVGGLYSYVETIAPQPAVRPSWPGEKIDLRRFSPASGQEPSPAAKLFNERHSTRDFDDRQPITLAELSRFLEATARVSATVETPLDPDADPAAGGPTVTHTVRPYPSGGASYELELYLAVNMCEGLPRGFYHYDAGAHALVPIAVRHQDFEAFLHGAEFAMGISARAANPGHDRGALRPGVVEI